MYLGVIQKDGTCLDYMYILFFALSNIRLYYKQARKLQDAQAEKLTSLQANKLTS